MVRRELSFTVRRIQKLFSILAFFFEAHAINGKAQFRATHQNGPEQTAAVFIGNRQLG